VLTVLNASSHVAAAAATPGTLLVALFAGEDYEVQTDGVKCLHPLATKRIKIPPVLVAHTCNPSYSGAEIRRIVV
jgi:hypothetical protein